MGRLRNLLLKAILRDVLANRCSELLEIDSHRRLSLALSIPCPPRLLFLNQGNHVRLVLFRCIFSWHLLPTGC